MKSGTTWNIRDLDGDARDAAIAAARRAGMPVNDWLNQAVARQVAEQVPASPPEEDDDEALQAVAESVADLTRRIRMMDTGTRKGISGLKGRLGEIEEGLGRASDLPGSRRARSLRSVTELVDRLNRDIDNADESALSQKWSVSQCRLQFSDTRALILAAANRLVEAQHRRSLLLRRVLRNEQPRTNGFTGITDIFHLPAHILVELLLFDHTCFKWSVVPHGRSQQITPGGPKIGAQT